MLHHVVSGWTLSSGSGSSGSLGMKPRVTQREVDRLQAVAHVEVVALRGQPAVDGARADRDQDLALLPEVAGARGRSRRCRARPR